MRPVICGSVSLALSLVCLVSAYASDSIVQSAQPASSPAVHVEGPHVLLHEDGVQVLWSCGEERHAMVIASADSVDVPSWRGTPEMKGLSLTPPSVGPSVFESPDRMLILGDIHGRYDPFVDVLREAGVIDDDDRWSFGSNHLVCCGDLMDRGAGVVASLWLLHRLEREAAAAGGAVHVLLGNHELMVVRNDLRYLHPDLVGVADVLGVPYPELFSKSSVLGRWLRTKHSIIKIGDLAFAHGGVGPTVLRYAQENAFDHDDINRLVRTHLDDTKETVAEDPMLAAIFGYPGPLWHRGYFIEDDARYDPASDADIDRVLAWLGVKAIAVGHTQFDRVGSHREGRVIATDVNLEKTPEAVLVENGVMLRISANGTQSPLRPLSADDS